MANQKSEYGSVNIKDFLWGAFWAIITAVATTLQQLYITSGNFDNISFKTVSGIAVSALLLYVIGKHQTNSQGKFLKKEEKSIYDNLNKN